MSGLFVKYKKIHEIYSPIDSSALYYVALNLSDCLIFILATIILAKNSFPLSGIFPSQVYLLVSVNDKDVRISMMQSMGYGGETTDLGSRSGSHADRTNKQVNFH